MKRFLALLLVVFMIVSLTACNKKSSSDDSNDHIVCSECGEKCDEDASFCHSCGAALLKTLKCGNCGSDNASDAKFCAFCGSTFASNGDHNSSIPGNNNNNNDTSHNGASLWLKTQNNTGDFSTIYFYDSNGFLVAERTAYKSNGKLYSLTEYKNDEHGNPILVQSTMPTFSTLGEYNVYREDTYTNRYDKNGNLISKTRNGQYTTTYTYDANGNLISEVNDSGEKIEYEYDANGWLTFKSSINRYGVCDQKEAYTYNADGILEKVIVHQRIEAPVAPSDHEIDSGEAPEAPVAPSDPEIDSGEAPEAPVAPSDPEIDSGETTEAPVAPSDPNSSSNTSSSPTPLTATYEYQFFYDANGNIVKKIQTDLLEPNTTKIEYQYALLSDYCAQGKDKILPLEAGQFPAHIGSAGCDYCAGHGHDYCQGHTCTACNGQGSTTCRGCGGSGKGYMINGSDTCRVCYGSGKQICPSCDGAKKKFYS